MPLFKLTAQAKLAQASPSVSLEKGAYRLRAPPKRSGLASGLAPRSDAAAAKLRMRRGSQGTSCDGVPLVYNHDKQMAMLVILLVCATVTCFGGAYYLFTTRCVAKRVCLVRRKLTCSHASVRAYSCSYAFVCSISSPFFSVDLSLGTPHLYCCQHACALLRFHIN